MLPLDDLGGDDVLLEISPSRTISCAGNDKNGGDANVIGIRVPDLRQGSEPGSRNGRGQRPKDEETNITIRTICCFNYADNVAQRVDTPAQSSIRVK